MRKKSLHTDFEILMSIYSALVAPTLAPWQNGMSGMMIHRIFKAKPLYVRPVDEIVHSNYLPRSTTDVSPSQPDQFQVQSTNNNNLENGKTSLCELLNVQFLFN